MAGTPEGGKAAAETNKSKYGENYYKRIGAMGGEAPYTKPKGFAARRDLARSAGKKGGQISRRKKKT